MPHKRFIPSITALLFFANTLVLVLCVAVFALYSVSSTRSICIKEELSNMEEIASMILPIIQGDSCDMQEAFFSKIKQENSIRLSLIDIAGNVALDTKGISDTSTNHANRSEVKAALSGKTATAIRQSTVSNSVELYVALPVIIRDNLYALRVSKDLHLSQTFSRTIMQKILLSSLLTLAIMLTLTLLVAAFIVRGIKELELATFDIENGKSPFALTSNVPKEILLLSNALTALFSNIKHLETVRRDFVSNVSHELKTPITSIVGFCETLVENHEIDTETRQRFLSIMQHEALRLNDIINDLLSLSKLEEKGATIETTLEDVCTVMQEVITNYKERALQKHITLDFVENSCVYCKINKELLEHSLSNIIDNAIKYCPKNASVHCQVQTTNRIDKNVALLIIEDTGQGIAKEERSRVFERFYRVDKGRSRSMGGTGLGLSIAMHIVILHKGKLYLEDKPDGSDGCRFVIELERVE